MKTFQKLAAAAAMLLALGGTASAQSKVTLAVGGASCLCYLPTVLAQQLGHFEKAGVTIDLVNFKGGSQALTALVGGSADVVSGYFDHTVALAAKKQALRSFVVFDRFPGLVLVVAPSQTGKITAVKDLAGKKVGVSAPGSSTDFFLKYELQKAGVDPSSAAVIGIGLGATAIASMEQGQVDAAVMADPSVTVLQNRQKDVVILSDTRNQKGTQEMFGGDYPGGVLYSTQAWIDAHPKETQALTDAMVATLGWIQSHSPEEIMAKMPADMVGDDKASYLAALKNIMAMFSPTGLMDPKGAQAVLDVFSIGSPEIAAAKIDIGKTYTNAYVEKAKPLKTN